MSGPKSLLQSRLARRMLVLFVACAVVPMSLLAAFVLSGVSGRLEAQAGRYLRMACRDAGRLAADGLAEVEDELIEIGALLIEMESEPRLQRAQVEAWRGKLLSELALYRDGRLVTASAPWELELAALAEEERAHLARGETLLHIDADFSANRTVVLLRAFVGAGGDEYLVAGRSGTDHMLRYYEFAEEDVEFRVFLLGDQVLASSLQEAGALPAVLGGLPDQPGSSGEFGIELSRVPWRVAYRSTFLRPRYMSDITVVAGLRSSEVNGPIAYFQSTFVLLALLATAAALLLGVTHIRRYLQPLSSLHEAATRIAAGDYAARTGIRSGDEFEELSASFDDMAARILRRTAELERANRAKSDFLATVSHELRTPLTSILGYVELCLEPEATPRLRTEYLRVVAESGRHLSGVIEDILDVANLESGRLEVERTSCETLSLVGEATRSLADAAAHKGLTFDVRCAGAVPERVHTDPGLVRQVLLNLVGNAIKFTDRGGVALVLACEPAGAGRERMVLEVHDTGCGIEARHAGSLFEPFSQADGSRARLHGGSGLGLAISRRIARALGGDVSCTSRPGEGSVFTFSFDAGACGDVERLQLGAVDLESFAPPAQAQASRRPAEVLETAAEAQPSLAGRRILVAEDSRVNLRLLRAILQREGFQVDPAESGVVALQMAETALQASSPHDLVLTDIQMPEMDGYELTRRLRAAGYTGPIVALTAHSMAGERERCLTAGCDEFATKPIDRVGLCALLGRLIAERADPRAA